MPRAHPRVDASGRDRAALGQRVVPRMLLESSRAAMRSPRASRAADVRPRRAGRGGGAPICPCGPRPLSYSGRAFHSIARVVSRDASRLLGAAPRGSAVTVTPSRRRLGVLALVRGRRLRSMWRGGRARPRSKRRVPVVAAGPRRDDGVSVAHSCARPPHCGTGAKHCSS